MLFGILRGLARFGKSVSYRENHLTALNILLSKRNWNTLGGVVVLFGQQCLSTLQAQFVVGCLFSSQKHNAHSLKVTTSVGINSPNLPRSINATEKMMLVDCDYDGAFGCCGFVDNNTKSLVFCFALSIAHVFAKLPSS